MNNFRSTFQNTLRTNARQLLKEFTEIPNIHIEEIKDYTTRSKSAEFKRLCNVDSAEWKTFPPILCSQNEDGELEDVMFKSDIIVKV
jgi:hypothetical protein